MSFTNKRLRAVSAGAAGLIAVVALGALVTRAATAGTQPSVPATASSAAPATTASDAASAPRSAAAQKSPYTFHPVGMGGTGFVTGLVAHPTAAGVVYGREDVGGLVRWNESTRTWTQLLRADRVPHPTASDYGAESVAVAASDARVVYAAVGTGDQGRILASTDRGEHWTDGGFRTYIEGNNDYRTGPERLAVDPLDAKVAMFGSRTGGLWRTADGGRTFHQVPLGQVPAGDTAHKIGIPFVLFDAGGAKAGHSQRIWVGVAGAGVFLSVDGGATFSRAYATADPPSDAKITNDGTLYVTYPAAIRRFTWSTPAGTDVSSPRPGGGLFLGVDPHDASRLLATSGAVTPGNLFRSTDGGRTWDTLTYKLASADVKWPLSTTEAGYLSTGTFVFDPTRPGRVWFPEGVGVFRSDDIFDRDKAVTWNFVSKGIEEAVTNDLIAPPGGAPISAIDDRNGFRHADVNGYPQRTIATDEFSAGTSLAYAGRKPSFVALVSSDTRAQFQAVDTPWTTAPATSYSTDGGVHWTRCAGGKDQITELYGGNIAVSADGKSMVWQPTIPAMSSQNPQNMPHYSTDNCRTWHRSTGVAPGGGIHDMIWWGGKRALDADTVQAGTFYLYVNRDHGQFFRSTDAGRSWVKMPGQPPTGDGNDTHVFGQIHAEPGQTGHVWSSNAQNGLSYTTDGGKSWTKVKAVQEAKAFGFGRAVAGKRASVYANAKIRNTWGVWRSDDQGRTWTLAAQYPAGYYTTISVVTGDMNVKGRVYVCFSTNGCVYGDSRS